MTKQFLVILMGILTLSACVPAQLSPPATITTIAHSTVIGLHTSIPIPTATRKPITAPTIISTPSSTLSPEQYPSLQNLALTAKDISSSSMVRLTQIFINLSSQPSGKQETSIVKNLTQELVSKNTCSIDCSRQSWAVPRLAIYITMIRTNSVDNALLLSQNYFDSLGTSVWYRLPNIDANDYKDVPAPNTWVVDKDAYYQSLGTTYGPIFVLIDKYERFQGDDFTVDVELMLEAANLQIEKLKAAGIPANP